MSKRAERVGQLIQQELADLLTNKLMDPRVGFVTVTEVRVADDLKNARVFVSIYGDDDARQRTLDGLHEAGGFLRHELGRRVKLRYTPELSFALDNTLDQAMRLERLLQAAKEPGQDADAAGDGAQAEVVPVVTARSAQAAQAAVLQEQLTAAQAKERAAKPNKKRRTRYHKR
jgi:ribosome-binding factor A